MKRNRVFRLLASLTVVVLCMTAFSVTAFAGGGDGDYYTGEPAETTPEPTEEPATGGMEPEGQPLTPEGNATLVDDYYGDKQLITVTTKAGNYFYILIDRANEDKETAGNIVMAVFDVAQNVVSQSAGVIISDAGIDISGVVGDLETQLADWSVGALLGLWFQSVFVGLCTQILSICIFLVIYGRMIEVYLVTSIGPIPFATMVNREWGSTGQNYLRSLLALGFQAFLIMICVGIYAVLVEGISTSGDNISAAIWGCMGYTVLLCYTLFKTGSLAKSLFGAH